METIRQRVLRLLSSEAPEHDADPDQGLAEALYWLLASPGVDLAVDGWSLFRVVRETADSIEVLGLMHLSPRGSVPISVNVSKENDGLAWSARAGHQDEQWLALTQSKRWQRVYLYAAGARAEPQWEWGARYGGHHGQAQDTKTQRAV